MIRDDPTVKDRPSEPLNQRFMKQYLKEIKVKNFVPGEIVTGHVVYIDKRFILLDVGSKSEGLIPSDEVKFLPSKNIELGQELSAIVVYPEDARGNLILSLKKAKSARGWEALQDAFDAQEVIDVQIIDYYKGGLIVDAYGQRGFVPISHLSRSHFEQFNNAMAGGQTSEEAKALGGLKNSDLQVKIIEIDPQKNRLVLSEKEASPQEELLKKEERLSEIQIGDIIEAKVSTVLPYGILVDLGGVDGLVHISEIAWEKVDSASDYYAVGDPIKVKVIGIDDDKIALSVKELKDNPWNNVEEKYPLGKVITAKVTKVVPFGAFIELEKGLDGLIHVSEMNDPLNVGDEVTAVVVNTDSKSRKLALSIRQIEDSKIYR